MCKLIESYRKNFEIWKDGNTHKTIFETALGKPARPEIDESLRRGGKTCHFIEHLS